MKKEVFLYLFLFLVILFALILVYLRLCNKIEVKTIKRYNVPELTSYKDPLLHKNNKGFIFNLVLPHSFKGVIQAKKTDVMMHNSKSIIILTENYYFEMGIDPEFGGIDSGLFDYCQVGDSIFKNSYSLVISIKRTGIVRNFNVTPYKEFWVNPYYFEKTNVRN